VQLYLAVQHVDDWSLPNALHVTTLGVNPSSISATSPPVPDHAIPAGGELGSAFHFVDSL
jgi:hypothetical protein